MSQGYSLRFASRVKKAYSNNKNSRVLRLGYLCVKHEVPASEVADYLQISRQTFYYWMDNDFSPSKEMMPRVEELIARLEKHYEQAK